MTRQEYEYLQERFSKLLAKKPYGRANEKEAYRSGVLAAKSVLKDVYEHSYSTAKDDGAADAIEALQAQLPKRGEIVRCKECIHFTQGGWCDREFDWFPVDENDFCSMAEKMEAQDESVF